MISANPNNGFVNGIVPVSFEKTSKINIVALVKRQSVLSVESFSAAKLRTPKEERKRREKEAWQKTRWVRVKRLGYVMIAHS